MDQDAKNKLRMIMDLEKLNATNSEGCSACGQKFTLGEMAVLACGSWAGGLKLIHEDEAIFDAGTSRYFERNFYKPQSD